MGTLTVNNLRRYFHPKPLFLRIMKVDKFRKEEDNCCSPEHYDIPVRMRSNGGERRGRTYCESIEGCDKL